MDALSPDELKGFLLTRVDATDKEPLTFGAIGALIHHLEEVCGGEEGRYLFLEYVYGVRSSKDLGMHYWEVIRAWLDPKPVDDPHNLAKPQWAVRAECFQEALAVVRLQREISYKARIEAMKAAGQNKLPGL